MPFLLLYWKYLAAFALLGLIVLFYNVHVDGLVKAGATKATTSCVSSFQASEEAGIAKARADAAAKEKDDQVRQDAIEAKHQLELKNVKAQSAHDVAAARAGTLRLRFATSTCPSGANLPNPAPAASGSNAAPASGELPQPIVEGLFGLANSADALASQLTACQAIILSDRKGASP